MARISKPTADNRAEALEYWWKHLGIEGDYSRELERSKLSLQDSISKNMFNAAAPASHIAIYRTHILTYQRWHGLLDADSALRLAFASFYWAAEFERVVRVNQKFPDSIHTNFWELLEWQGVAAACGEAWFVEWLAPYLQRFLAKEVAFEHMLTDDEQGRQFLALLQAIIQTKHWPDHVKESDFGAFAPLFNDANNPVLFEKTLMDFCDYRLAQTYGYPSIDAEKKRKRGKEWSIYEEAIFLNGVWPTELLTLQYAYQEATGKKMSLDAPHPLLQSNLMKLPFPKLIPLVEDETNEKIKSFAKKLYGAAWQPQQT